MRLLILIFCLLSLIQPVVIQSQEDYPSPILYVEDRGELYGVGWDPAGSFVATYSEAGEDNWLGIWYIGEEYINLWATTLVRRCGESDVLVCRVEWNHGGLQIALSSDIKTLIYGSETGREELVSEQHFSGWDEDNSPILSDNYPTAYDATRNRLATAHNRAEIPYVEVTDYENESVLFTHEFGENDTIESMAFLPDGDQLALIISPDKSTNDVYLWDLETDTFTDLEEIDPAYITEVKTFDHYVIGYGRGTLVTIWDSTSREIAARINRYATDVDVSPDGRYLATVYDNLLEIWDVDSLLP